MTLQTGGSVVKATAPDLATGAFRLTPVAPGTYDLVITVPGRTTAVITGVKVLPDTLTDVSDTPLAPLACDCGTVQGRVTAPATTLGLDALVQVNQALGPGGPAFEIARMMVDAQPGEYRFGLPVVAPVVAAFSASGAARLEGDEDHRVVVSGAGTHAGTIDTGSGGITVRFGL